MAQFEDYDNWRQQSTGGIKYRFKGLEGSLDPEEGEITWHGVFRSQDLLALAAELFPPPLVFGNLVIPRAGTMPGIPNFVAKRMTFKSLVDGMPIDPFSADSSAPADTYLGYIEVDITFGPENKREVDPNDPRTFLEIKASEGGEFIYASPEDVKLADETNSLGEDDETTGGPIDPDTGEQKGTVTQDGDKRPNRKPTLPSTILVPTTNWSVTWKQIPYNVFKNVTIHRLRLLNGRVNSLVVPFMLSAAPETLLFNGFDYTESYTWRDGLINTPPIDVTFKLIEKRVIWRGIICGHNHVWEPGVGWRRMWVGPDGDERPYRLFDFNFLFKT